MNEHVDSPSTIDLTVPAIDVKLQLPLDDGSGRVLVFGTVVPQHCEDGELNAVLDKLSRAGERQKSLVLLPTYEADLLAKRETLLAEAQKAYTARQEFEQQKDMFVARAASSGRRGEVRLSNQDAAALQKLEAVYKQHEQNMRVLEKQIDSEDKRVALYKARLGKGE